MQLPQNQKIFSQLFSASKKSASNLKYFQRDDDPQRLLTSEIYRLQKAGLPKCLRSPVSQHLWTGNTSEGPKHYLNLQGRIFVIFSDHSERKSSQKICFSSI